MRDLIHHILFTLERKGDDTWGCCHLMSGVVLEAFTPMRAETSLWLVRHLECILKMSNSSVTKQVTVKMSSWENVVIRFLSL